MGGADEHDPEVHAEEEDLEDLRLGEPQHDDPAELGEGDPREDGAPHVDEGGLGPRDAVAVVVEREGADDVGAELDGDADGHDEVDEGDAVELDGPPVHHSHEVDEDHEDGQHDDQGGEDVKACGRRSIG